MEAFELYVVHARQGSERNTLAASEENVKKYYTILSPRANVLAKEIVGTRNSPAIISLYSQFFYITRHNSYLLLLLASDLEMLIPVSLADEW